jgi:hypothetical protein
MHREIVPLQDMMLFLNWTRAAILYEDDYGLIRYVFCSFLSKVSCNF